MILACKECAYLFELEEMGSGIKLKLNNRDFLLLNKMVKLLNQNILWFILVLN